MPKFGAQSQAQLGTCHPQLQELLRAVVADFDCKVLCGHRNQQDQHTAYVTGHSKLDWPNSKHNTVPSRGVDVVPYPVDFKDETRFHYFAGYVMGVAARLGIRVRWGGDWDSDTQVNDERWRDLAHFELREV